MEDPRQPQKRGFRTYAERDRERRLAEPVSDGAPAGAGEAEVEVPAEVPDDEAEPAVDRT